MPDVVTLPGDRRATLWAAATGGVFAILPALLPAYSLLELCEALVLSIACLALNLLLGTTGLLSLGQAAFFGIGAYAGGFLFTLYDVGSLEAYLLSGMAAAAALAALVGAFCVRATRIHFTIMTLAVAQIVHALFIAGVVFRLGGGFGRGLFLLGGGGLYLPRLTILGREPTPELFIPALYYVIAVAFFSAMGLLWRVGRSPFGAALRAIRDNEMRAVFVGIPVRQLRWRAFVLSGIVTGLAGGLYGELQRQVTPEQLHWIFSAKLVLATIVGGTRYFLGPVAGAFTFVALQHIALRFTLYHGLVMGTLLIAVVFVFPGGVAGTVLALGRSTGFGRSDGRPSGGEEAPGSSG